MRTYNWVRVNSSNIEQIAYDASQKELLVAFKTGLQYYYINVPEQLFEDFKKAPSPGRFLHEHIKKDYGYGRER